METQTVTDGSGEEFDNPVDAVESVADQIEERREREEERHEEELERINDAEEELYDNLYTEYGLDELEEQFRELHGIRKDIKSVRGEIVNAIRANITAHLSGGYNNAITVKNGGVHRYRKKKRSKISFPSLVEGRYHDEILDALEQDAPSHVRRSLANAFGTLSQYTNNGRNPSFDTTLECSAELTFDKFDWRVEHHTYNYVEFTYSTTLGRYNSSYHRVEVKEDDSYGADNRRMEIGSRNPDDIKVLVQIKDELSNCISQTKMDMQSSLENWEMISDIILKNLPDVDE